MPQISLVIATGDAADLDLFYSRFAGALGWDGAGTTTQFFSTSVAKYCKDVITAKMVQDAQTSAGESEADTAADWLNGFDISIEE